MSGKSRLMFPRAFAIAIDDLGWNEGSNLLNHTPSGPYRVGVKRSFTQDDYQVIVDVGKAVGVRIQGLFILSEMDRANVLANYPTTTYLREKWDNSTRVSKEQLKIMDYVSRASAYLEFGLHGTGHEYWAEDGIQRRAEWYNMVDRRPWPEEELRSHIQAFREIMAQYDLTPRQGHSFPESFVPCAYSYYWNPVGSYSLGKLVAEAGVKYANTDFAQIPELSPPQEVNGGGFDNGVHVINRMNYGNLWYELTMLPKVTIDMQGTDIIESHWANWLAQDDFMQRQVTRQWINYYLHVQQQDNRYLAKNTEQLHSQWLYKKYAKLTESRPGVVEIDNTLMPDDAYGNELLGSMVLKLTCADGCQLSAGSINGQRIPAIFVDQGFTFIYLPPLKQQRYVLNYEIGSDEMKDVVLHDGTYNVYSLQNDREGLLIELKMYGEQTVKIRCEKPTSVVSLAAGLEVRYFAYDESSRCVAVTIAASDFQGSRGRIALSF